MNWQQWRDENLANWEERVPIHTGPDGYRIAALLADPTALSGVVSRDAPHLGDLNGLDVVHLQCHIGTDTLSLARLGATVTGLDFSPAALASAADLFARDARVARFVHADLYDAPGALGERYDLVYTGIGALNWLPDIRRWAQVVAALLRPGGRLYVRDMHPMFSALDFEAPDGELRLAYPYFETAEPVATDWETTYEGDGTRLTNTRNNEWSHGLAETVTALLEAGLRITSMREDDFCEWRALPWMVEVGDEDIYVLPSGRNRLPFLFTIEAVAGE